MELFDRDKSDLRVPLSGLTKFTYMPIWGFTCGTEMEIVSD